MPRKVRVVNSAPMAKEDVKDMIMRSALVKSRERFNSSDVAKVLNKTEGCASIYLNTLTKEGELVKHIGDKGRVTYSVSNGHILSLDWRINQQVYIELEDELTCL